MAGAHSAKRAMMSRGMTMNASPPSQRSSCRRPPASSRALEATSGHRPLTKQVLAHEHDRRVELEIGVALLAESVTFIGGHEVPHGTSVLLDLRHHLLRLGARHPGIVAALHDEERLGDLSRIVQR